jgi:protein AATF/BFR2
MEQLSPLTLTICSTQTLLAMDENVVPPPRKRRRIQEDDDIKKCAEYLSEASTSTAKLEQT